MALFATNTPLADVHLLQHEAILLHLSIPHFPSSPPLLHRLDRLLLVREPRHDHHRAARPAELRRHAVLPRNLRLTPTPCPHADHAKVRTRLAAQRVVAPYGASAVEVGVNARLHLLLVPRLQRLEEAVGQFRDRGVKERVMWREDICSCRPPPPCRPAASAALRSSGTRQSGVKVPTHLSNTSTIKHHHHHTPSNTITITHHQTPSHTITIKHHQTPSPSHTIKHHHHHTPSNTITHHHHQTPSNTITITHHQTPSPSNTITQHK